MYMHMLTAGLSAAVAGVPHRAHVGEDGVDIHRVLHPLLCGHAHSFDRRHCSASVHVHRHSAAAATLGCGRGRHGPVSEVRVYCRAEKGVSHWQQYFYFCYWQCSRVSSVSSAYEGMAESWPVRAARHTRGAGRSTHTSVDMCARL
jgi:hypothetical protein